MIKRWGLVAVVLFLTVAGTAPARGALGDWGGAGAVTGTLQYDYLPGYLKTCAWNVPVEIAVDAPAFALQTPTGPQVVSLSVRGSGTGAGNCVSESLAGGSLRLELRAGDIHCEGITAYYIRVAADFQMQAATPRCSYGESGTAPGYHWLFRLAYVDGRLAGTVTYAPA